ncbi:hypothetical protein ACEQPO_18445 [Bacillus sp. SL00103]
MLKRVSKTADPGNILPKNPSRTYDVKQVVTTIIDSDSFFETVTSKISSQGLPDYKGIQLV